MADLSDLFQQKLDLDNASGGASSSSSSSSSSSAAAPVPLKLTDVPNQVLVSIFVVAAGVDKFWARFTIHYVCKAFRDLYRSRDASPLHSLLWLDFAGGVAAAKLWVTSRSYRHEPDVCASRIISWARMHAESVRTLLLYHRKGASLSDFNVTNFAQFVAAVGPHVAGIMIFPGFKELIGPPFWAVLRDRVVPAQKLRILRVLNIPKSFSMSDVEPWAQLRGSLEQLGLYGSSDNYGNPSIGLRRFPEAFCTLKNLEKLVLDWHFWIKAIPAGISNLKKLQFLGLCCCDLRSLPKELGALSQLEHLAVTNNITLGAAPDDVAFPPELKGMMSLRELYLNNCGLRRVPAFVRELSSLELIWLDKNRHLQIDAPLEDLVECYPRLHVVKTKKELGGTWNPQSLAHLEAFKAKLLAKNPSAEVEL